MRPMLQDGKRFARAQDADVLSTQAMPPAVAPGA